MIQAKHVTLSLIVMALGAALSTCATGAEMPAAEAWKALPKYEPGQDMAPLLTIDREVIAAMASPKTRAACAARLAGLLASKETTPAARQYICLQLRQVGTAAQVPLLGQMLAQPETSEMARYALQTISGPEAGAALRAGLKSLEGKLLVGVINSLGARKDAEAEVELERLADSSDAAVGKAAIGALGSMADRRASEFLLARAEKAGALKNPALCVALLRCAAAGQNAAAIYKMLSQPDQATAFRRSALEGLLRIEGANVQATVLAWFASGDADRRRIAAGHLQKLPDAQLDKLLAELATLPDAGKLAVIELAASRRGADMLPTVLGLVNQSNPDLKLAGVRCLGMIGDVSTMGVLIDQLGAGGAVAEAAQSALGNLPRKELGQAMLEALRTRPALRAPVIEILIGLKCYEAIDPLVEIAASTDPDEYGPALDGLRGIADPDKSDIRRLVKLLLRTEPGRHRDEVEKTILIVCDKLPAKADRSALVLATLAGTGASEAPKYLPLLGRLGGAKALAMIEKSMAGNDPAVQEAAVRALANWPNAEVADKLLALATDSKNSEYRRWALRAYIRVVTLASNRPEATTLAMLQNAFRLAAEADDKCLAIDRASTIRTMATVTWIAGFLDDPELAQAACGSIVKLAHHRFLRHPNMDRFGPILEKVARISQDPDIAESAKRYRLGL